MPQAKEIIRFVTDTALDAAASYGLDKGEETLARINARSQKNLAVSAALNGALLVCAALSAVFMRELNGAGFLAAAIINYALLGRALFSLLRFCHTVLIPYKKIITFSLMVFMDNFKTTKSIPLSIQETILFVTDYYYEDKVPSILKTAHLITADYGFVKTRGEIKNAVVDKFYPLVCRFLRTVLLYNVLLFMVCYGFLIFLLKRFVIGAALGMSMFDLYVYPFRFFYTYVVGG